MSETNLQLFPGIFRSTVGGENPGFFLHSDGRVGIGNKAPTARPTWDTDPNSTEKNKLNVSGHTHIEGNLDVTGSVYGDGSNMTGVTLPWTQSTPNLATDIKYEGGNVGIGGEAGTEALTVYGDLNLKSGGQLKLNGQTSVFSNWSVDGSDIYRSAGNVGIGGAASGTNKLKVHGTVEATSFSGIQASDVSGLGSFATLSSYPTVTQTDFRWTMGGTGTTSHANYGGHGDWYIRSNHGSGKVILQDTGGNVGVGTSNPLAKLHINGSAGFTINTGWLTYFGPYSGSFSHNSNSSWGGGGSIYATSHICTQGYHVSGSGSITASDSRIKKEIVDVEDGAALETLRLLKPKQYKYKDEFRRGSEPVWGFIAQEVRDTLPYASQLRTECVPNIYELANVSASNVITFSNFYTSNLESNAMVLKVFDVDDAEHLVNITEVVDDHSVRVEEDLSEWTGSVDESGNVAAGNQLFVYGQRVDDFVFLKKDAIWTVATSALQEVDRQLQAEREKVASLEERLAALEANQ
uniref:Peptidase S74 domain-containing protein n=1 Tax=viral metagenome TaxID=1070528 RepID=A0A6C0CNI5_9ZZZZ